MGDTAEAAPGLQLDNIDDEDDEVDTVAVERRKQREIEISRLRKEVDEANLAKDRREAEKVEAKMREESMRRELLGDVTAMEEGGGTKKRPQRIRVHSVDSEEWVERHDDDDDGEEWAHNASLALKIIKKNRRMSFDKLTAGPSLIANMVG